jgi:hypothetical protein
MYRLNRKYENGMGNIHLPGQMKVARACKRYKWIETDVLRQTTSEARISGGNPLLFRVLREE